jgi:hypothetical protein
MFAMDETLVMLQKSCFKKAGKTMSRNMINYAIKKIEEKGKNLAILNL